MRTTLLILAFVPLLLSAQYSTPGTGVHWNLDSLVLYSGGVVTNGLNAYEVNEDLIISPTDSLSVLTYNMSFAPAVIFTIEGYTSIGGFGPVFSSMDTEDIYAGLRIEADAEAYFDYVRFEGGGGVKCISGDVTFTHCEFIAVQHIATSNAALELFSGSPIIEECLFESSLGSAISSPANIGCGPSITNSVFLGNNTENTNRPQINLGPSTDFFQINITGNQVEGNPQLTEVGGIACTSLFGDFSDVYINDNYVFNNRYGLTLTGGSIFGYIYYNDFIDNDTQNEPFLGGSGINLNGPGSSFVEVEGNMISGNLWGITVQGEFGVTLGLVGSIDGSLGYNVFDSNGNGGVTYALFNNTPNTIFAQNNCWIAGQESTAAEIEDVISHQVDDASLGLVNFSEHLCGTVGVDEFNTASISIYPNPSSDFISIDTPHDIRFEQASIRSVLGTQVMHFSPKADGRIDIRSLLPGQYIIELHSDTVVYRKSFIKE